MPNRYDELTNEQQYTIDSLINALASITSDKRGKLAEAIKATIESVRPTEYDTGKCGVCQQSDGLLIRGCCEECWGDSLEYMEPAPDYS